MEFQAAVRADFSAERHSGASASRHKESRFGCGCPSGLKCRAAFWHEPPRHKESRFGGCHTIARNQKHKVAQERGLNIEKRKEPTSFRGNATWVYWGGFVTKMSERTSAEPGASAQRPRGLNSCESKGTNRFPRELEVRSERTRANESFSFYFPPTHPRLCPGTAKRPRSRVARALRATTLFRYPQPVLLHDLGSAFAFAQRALYLWPYVDQLLAWWYLSFSCFLPSPRFRVATTRVSSFRWHCLTERGCSFYPTTEREMALDVKDMWCDNAGLPRVLNSRLSFSCRAAPFFIFLVVALFFIAGGCSVFSAFFFVCPVALRDEDLDARGYGCTGTCLREVRLLALAEVSKGPWSLWGPRGMAMARASLVCSSLAWLHVFSSGPCTVRGPWSCWPQPLESGGDATLCEDTRQDQGCSF